MTSAKVLVGIFVGGASSRMGRAKGLLPAPDGAATLVERLARVARDAAPGADVVLVGAADAYAALGFETIADAPANVGPLGGLIALSERALEGQCDAALALACDLPFVDPALVEKVLRHAPDAAAVAPHVDGMWQPLCARYAPGAALAAARDALNAGERALWRVLARLGERAREVPLTSAEQLLLVDWDAPADLRG
jgi:molybdenum cofactor guanylyltransferase